MSNKDSRTERPRNKTTASERLRKNLDAIIRKWEEKVCKDIPAAKEQTRPELRDSLPKFLARLADALSPDKMRPVDLAEVKDVSEEHGCQRASLDDYSLHQMLAEYGLLREELIETLEQEGPIETAERDIILSAIETGMAQAGERFIERIRGRERAFEDRYRIVVEGAKDHAIIRTDKSGEVIDWNSGAENILGYSKKEILGRNIDFVFTPEDQAQRVAQKEMQIAEQKGKAEDERWHLKKDGSRFFATGIMNPLRDEYGNIVGFIKVLRDHTTKKLKDELIQSEHEWLQSVFDLMPIGVFLLNPESGKVVFSNHVSHQIAEGYASALPFDNPSEYFATDVVGHRIPIEELPRSRVSRGEAVKNFEMNWNTPTKTITIQVQGEILPGVTAGSDLTLICFQDITDLKKAGDTLHKTISELTEEREVRERFVATLTHDLRNPMSAIKSSAQLILRYPEKHERHIELAGRIVGSIERADTMITNLLDAYRVRAGERLHLLMEYCDLAAVTRDTIEELKMVHGERFKLKAPSTLMGHWSCDGLQRAIENLASNGVKYGSPTAPIEIVLRKLDDHVEICVHNEGRGLTKDEQKDIFTSFHRTKSAEVSGKRGWGLGLALVRGIAEAHRGEVRVESARDQGASFIIQIPIQEDEPL